MNRCFGGECSLVAAPGFKPARGAILIVLGVFDSHTPPPFKVNSCRPAFIWLDGIF